MRDTITASSVLDDFRRRGVTIEAGGDRLRFRPLDVLTPTDRDSLHAYKADLLALLAREVADAGRHRYEDPCNWDGCTYAIALVTDTIGVTEWRCVAYGHPQDWTPVETIPTLSRCTDAGQPRS